MQYYSEFLWKKNCREANEDSISIVHVFFNGKPLILAVLCDGVGGLNNGEFASSFVVSSIKSHFESLQSKQSVSLCSLRHSLSRTLYYCHSNLNGCATTVSLAVIYNNHALLMSCGDSRIYAGSTTLTSIFRDQSDSRGRLTHAIGSVSTPLINSRIRHLRPGVRILLCSDGFYKKNNSEITSRHWSSSLKTESQWKDALESMYCNAVNMGEKDNCSAIIIWTERK